SLITGKDTRYMDVNLDRGGNYGDTLSWAETNKPKVEVQPVEVQFDLTAKKFYDLFVALLTAPTPNARGAK
ncbi:MAG TPA: hypothetical protein VJP04_09855, partial [Terriglobales bacterium]|nr:hypothetical protein [Terriglobales bacterium]